MEAAEEQTIQIEKEQSNAVQYRVHTKFYYPKPVSEAKRSSQCGLCGGSYPHKGQCPAKGSRCLTCDKLNHFAKIGRSRAVSNEKPAQKKSYRRPKQRARAVTTEGAESQSDFMSGNKLRRSWTNSRKMTSSSGQKVRPHGSHQSWSFLNRIMPTRSAYVLT